MTGPSKRDATGTQACNVALVGFGTVGSSVAKILCERSNAHLRLTHILNRNVARKKVDWLPSSVQWTENIDDVLSSNADIVVEVMGGLQPTEDWIRRTLQSGKSVVTANKQLIAHCGPELISLARQMNQQIEFGASVAGGVPVISGLHEGLAGDELFKIRGILNGTCNYILSQIETNGIPFATALREAQKLGFAEADPTEDIEGLDARAKLAILARVGLHCHVRPESIMARSISAIDSIDFEYANQLHCTIRQISWAEFNAQSKTELKAALKEESKGDTLFAAVQPALVELSSPLARVEGSQNLVVATGRYGGETVFGGHGAGGNPTAVAVVSDILAIARSKQSAITITMKDAGQPIEKTPTVTADFTAKHYLRFLVKDRPGIIASFATILSQCGINIDSVLQKPGCPKSHLPFLITLEECKASLVEQALQQINSLDFLVQPCLHLPIL
ncbi:MAG: homoserine dehydrogenase [Terriglobales bacterium]